MNIKILTKSNSNHEWDLTDQEVKRLISDLLTLPGTLVENTEPNYSNYEGISIRISDNDSLKIYCGIAELITNNEVRRFLDVGRDLEEWLIKTGTHRITNQITFYEIIMKEFV